MKTKSAVSLFTLLCVISLIIEACTMPSAHPLVPPTALFNYEGVVGLQRPLNGTIYRIEDGSILFDAVASTISSASINEITFLVNSASIGTPTYASDFHYSRHWTPPHPGEYYIQGRVVFNDGTIAISPPARICVMSSLANRIEFDSGGGYLGSCEIPTRIPNAATSGNIHIATNIAAPNSISFSTNPACPQSNMRFSIITRVDDPQDKVVFARVILYLFSGNDGNNFFLNWVTTRPVNQKEYRFVIYLSPAQWAEVPNGVLRWNIELFGRDGQRLYPTGVSEGAIPVQRIECSQQRLETAPSDTPAPLEIIPSETPTPMLVTPPTFTLKKNAFCRKGPDMSFSDVTAVTAGETVDILNVSEDGFWYFIYWKKFDAKCWVATGTGDVNGDVTGLKVLIGPTLSAPEPVLTDVPVVPPGCSSYGDASSCTTHGCSWDKPTSSCH